VVGGTHGESCYGIGFHELKRKKTGGLSFTKGWEGAYLEVSISREKKETRFGRRRRAFAGSGRPGASALRSRGGHLKTLWKGPERGWKKLLAEKLEVTFLATFAREMDASQAELEAVAQGGIA